MLILAICLRPLFRAALPAAARSRIAAMEMADVTRTRSLVSMVSWLDFAVAKKPNKRCIFCAPTRIRFIIITNYVRSELCVSGTFSETLWPTCLVVARHVVLLVLQLKPLNFAAMILIRSSGRFVRRFRSDLPKRDRRMSNWFSPRIEVLPLPQIALFLELNQVPLHFALYGGTALALHLGHRESTGFDFFSLCRRQICPFGEMRTGIRPVGMGI